jgi:hypothetical protein
VFRKERRIGRRRSGLIPFSFFFSHGWGPSTAHEAAVLATVQDFYSNLDPFVARNLVDPKFIYSMTLLVFFCFIHIGKRAAMMVSSWQLWRTDKHMELCNCYARRWQMARQAAPFHQGCGERCMHGHWSSESASDSCATVACRPYFTENILVTIDENITDRNTHLY